MVSCKATTHARALGRSLGRRYLGCGGSKTRKKETIFAFSAPLLTTQDRAEICHMVQVSFRRLDAGTGSTLRLQGIQYTCCLAQHRCPTLSIAHGLQL